MFRYRTMHVYIPQIDESKRLANYSGIEAGQILYYGEL